jgi:hypothetical protein
MKPMNIIKNQVIGKRTFSCTTEEDDDEQLLAELGDFR